jgi:tetratricopeptide (TPR) repeat protein
LAYTLHMNAQDDECERLYRGAIAFAADSWSEPAARSDTVRNLAVFLTQKSRFEEAEPVWADLCKWITANPGNSGYGLTPGYLRQQIQWFYQRWGKPVPSQWDQDIKQMSEAAITESSKQITQKDTSRVDIISSLHTRADLYDSIGQHPKAIADYIRVLQLQRESPVSPVNDIDSTMQRLAELEEDAGETAKAEPLFRLIMEDRRRTLGELDPNTLYATETYGFFQRDRLNNPVAAAEIFHQTLAVWRTIPGDHSYQIANMSRHLGWTEHLAHHEDESIRLQRIALAYPLATWHDRFERAYGVRELARTYTDTRRYAEAEPLWLELAQWTASHPDNDAPYHDLDPQHIFPMIQNFYRVWGKPVPTTFEAFLLIKAPPTAQPAQQ